MALSDQDIKKLAATLTKSLATKDDIKQLEIKLESKIDKLEDKVDHILVYADRIEETTSDHEKRLKRIEVIPAIAHEIKK